MARAWEYGHNRLVGGIHFASDIEMGRIAGAVIAQTISTHPDFKTEFEAAKTELRGALGLSSGETSSSAPKATPAVVR